MPQLRGSRRIPTISPSCVRVVLPVRGLQRYHDPWIGQVVLLKLRDVRFGEPVVECVRSLRPQLVQIDVGLVGCSVLVVHVARYAAHWVVILEHVDEPDPDGEDAVPPSAVDALAGALVVIDLVGCDGEVGSRPCRRW